jgi:NADH:ubiquinone oxidoreductase subunit E
MSDSLTPDAPPLEAEPLPGFFGAEPGRLTEEIDPGVWQLIDEFLARHPGGQERLIPLLHSVQEYLGYLPFPVQEYVAGALGMSPIQIYGVVSFYHLFTTTPRGKHQLKVCLGTACFVRHSQRLIEAIGRELDIDVGDVTEDRLFSLEQVRCLGSCGLAPAMMHNDETFGNLGPQDVLKLVRRWKSAAGEQPQPERPEATRDE